jgi:hypothetical protein
MNIDHAVWRLRALIGFVALDLVVWGLVHSC